MISKQPPYDRLSSGDLTIVHQNDSVQRLLGSSQGILPNDYESMDALETAKEPTSRYLP